MKQSLAAVLSAPRAIEVVPVPVGPRPAAGAWLEVEACGVCGSDWSWYAERPISAPFVPGHEIVGRITHTWGYHGNAAFEVGGRVAIEEALPCWSCAVCRSGRHRLCPRSTRYGGTPLATAPALWGGFSQYTYLAPGTSAHAVPSSLDADLATLFIPVSNGLSWVRSAGRLSPGESAAVIGVGQHGLACVAAARRCGSGTLVAVGRAGDQARLDAAVKLGADVIVDADREDWVAPVLAATDGLGADLLVDTAPAPPTSWPARCGAVRRGAARTNRCASWSTGAGTAARSSASSRPGTPSRSAASTTAGPTGTTVSWSGSRTRDGIAPMSGNVWACSPCPGWRATAA